MPEQTSLKLIEELSTAYQTEVSGYHFYRKVAEGIENKRGRNVFEHLAEEELDHIKAISTISESVKSGAGWITYEQAVEAGASINVGGLPIYPQGSELETRLKENQTDLNAVKIAIEIEEKAVDFYSSLLAKAKTPDEKVLLTKLLEMEKGHLKVLRWESEALVRTGFWGDTMEFSVEKEVE